MARSDSPSTKCKTLEAGEAGRVPRGGRSSKARCESPGAGLAFGAVNVFAGRPDPLRMLQLAECTRLGDYLLLSYDVHPSGGG